MPRVVVVVEGIWVKDRQWHQGVEDKKAASR